MELPFDHDYELEKHYHPENFEEEVFDTVIKPEEVAVEGELHCPIDGSRLWEYPQGDSPDDYHMIAFCKDCDYQTE